MVDSLIDSNLAITFSLVFALGIIAAVKRFLDASGILAAGIIGIIVGIGGHWTWLAILLIFLITGSFATRWSYDEKDARYHVHQMAIGIANLARVAVDKKLNITEDQSYRRKTPTEYPSDFTIGFNSNCMSKQ